MAAASTENPLLDRWREIMIPHYERQERSREEYSRTGKFRTEWTDEELRVEMEPFRLRRELCKEYAWAIPTDEALDAIAQYSPQGLVEIGAGTGYWAGLLRKRGLFVVAYDSSPYDNIHADAKWSAVETGGPEKAALWPQLTLFLCWPPYDDPMAALCLNAYAGDTLIYIGEGDSGCTGDETFHKELEAKWEEIGDISLPQWEGIHDGLYVYQRTV